MSRSISRTTRTALAIVSLGLLALVGCKKKPVDTGEAPTTSAPTMSFAVGDKIDVNWKGSWWKGEVLSVDGAKYKIHYVGWSATWDESVTADRVRARTEEAKSGTEQPAIAAVPAPEATASAEATAKAATASPYKVGSKVDVNWKGSWYQGQVIGTPSGQFRVHYIGFAASWDENVPASRLRPWTGSAKKGTGPT